MAEKKTAEAVKTEGRKSITLRGRTYELRELTIGEYDECMSKSMDTKINALTGEEIETPNRTRLLRLMLQKSSGLGAGEIAGLATPVVFKLNELVNEIHYIDEPEDKNGSDGGEDEGEGKG